MSRIFSALALLSITLLCTAIGFGLYVGKYNELYASLLQMEGRLRQSAPSATVAEIADAREEIDQVYEQLDVPKRRATLHMLIGIVASLVAVLVSSVSITYFIGTSRWCKEVVDTYDLDVGLAAESARLKRRSFSWALVGIVLVLMIAACGAASDPGTLRATTGKWVLPHYAAALGGGAMIAVAFLVQAGLIHRNSELVDRILGQVREIRVQRGLDVDV